MRVVAVILARLDSRRLPGKALLTVCGVPLVQYVYKACLAAQPDAVILATSSRAADRDLVDWAHHAGCGVVLGSANNVASRFLTAMDATDADAGIRVNGDSPMQRPEMLARGVAVWRATKADVVTNVPGRMWPAGVSVEVIRRDAMARAVRDMTSEADREHVTTFFYDNPQRFNVHLLPAGPGWSRQANLAVDTPDDLRRFERIVEQLGHEFWTAPLSRLVDLARSDPSSSPDGGR